MTSKKKLKMKAQLHRCAKCHGAHTDWWKTTPPPSCAERQRKVARGE